MGNTKKVALLIETSNSYARGLLHGIAEYLRENGRWSIHMAETARGGSVPSWLRNWDGDGIIARIENRNIAKALRMLRIPIVDLSSARLIPKLHWVETDDKAIAELAAGHLMGLGLRDFAYCGDRKFNWSLWREEHFCRIIGGIRKMCHVFNLKSSSNSGDSEETESIAKWIRSLPKPLGLFACYDFRGRQVLEACRKIGLKVPDEVAVIGVDNDELICELSEPPMSSIIPNTRLTGYVAAELLDKLMSGKRIPAAAHLIRPSGIVSRRSTDILSIEDARTSDAVRFIRDNACRGICVKDVLESVPHSRRVLESNFKKYLGRTPHEEIIRIQIARVKMLLSESSLSLKQIAARTGFDHVEYMSVAFRREVGIPPGRYRILNRPSSR